MDNDAPLSEQPEQPLQPVQPDPSPVEDAPALAGFWVRGGAYVLDSLILALGALLPVKGLSILVGLTYKTIFVSQGGQTPGKMAAGIKVVTLTSEPVSVGRALGRAAAEWLSAITLFLGYLVAAFSDKRALHDYIAGTRVVYVDGVGAGRKAFFAFLGVMGIIVPILSIGALASLGGGFGKYKSLIHKSGEGATKGNLGMLRSSASIFYGDHEGVYPAKLEELISPEGLKEIPKTKIGVHPETASWTVYGAEVCTGSTKFGESLDGSKLKDTGGWGYVVDPKAPCYGEIFVDCTHEDSKSKLWYSY